MLFFFIALLNLLFLKRLKLNVMLTEKDLTQLSERNVSENQVIQQVAQLKRGTKFVQLMRPATISDGILRLDAEQIKAMEQVFDADKEYYQFTKFVPASGAASRMFKDLFSFLENGAMADWITVFVEVPIETFNPVKTVNDLLKPMHN